MNINEYIHFLRISDGTNNSISRNKEHKQDNVTEGITDIRKGNL